MSISIEEFEEIIPMPKGCGMNSVKIVAFLFKNREQAFTYKEISNTLQIDKDKMHGYLNHLKKIGKIRHRAPFYAYNPDYKLLEIEDEDKLTKNKKELGDGK